MKKLPYDSIRDFAPITLVADSPLIFIAHPVLGVRTIAELIAQAKSRPGRINYASSGPGTGGHLSVELLKWMTGIDLVHVPYKGAGPALFTNTPVHPVRNLAHPPGRRYVEYT